jgi:hypothetical protein
MAFVALLAGCATVPPIKPMPPIPEAMNAMLATCDQPLGEPQQTFPSKLEHFPAKAMRERVQGWAVMELSVRPDGTVHSVKIVAEEPAGYGFGSAATTYLSEQRYPPRKAECVYQHPVTFAVSNF